MFVTEKVVNGGTYFSCTICDYTCSRKYDFDKHISTDKHQKNQSGDNFGTVGDTKFVQKCKFCEKDFESRHGLWYHYKKCFPKPPNYDFGNTAVTFGDKSVTAPKVGIQCKKCDKTFKSRNGLWSHNKKNRCPVQPPQHNQSDVVQITSMFIESMNKNQEFQKQMFDMMKENIGTINNHSNNTTTTNNNKFNLNFFLNETCKDAMNLSDFVNSLQITLSDLENVGKLGYAEGISRIFTNGLKELDVSKRPIHCSDLKRETVYVKNENKWEKERDQLKKAIKQITNKNIKLIPMWKEEYPEHNQYHNKKNDEYLKIMYESMGPTDESEESNSYKKIMKNLAKETIISREQRY